MTARGVRHSSEFPSFSKMSIVCRLVGRSWHGAFRSRLMTFGCSLEFSVGLRLKRGLLSGVAP